MHFSAGAFATLFIIGIISVHAQALRGSAFIDRRGLGPHGFSVRAPQAIEANQIGKPKKGGNTPSTPTSVGATAATATPGWNQKTFIVQVGNKNVNQSSVQSLVYVPNTLTAAVGDIVEFQFNPANHSVSESAFDNPCVPISAMAISSGFVPVVANSTEIKTFSITVKTTEPMFLYCAQGPHCQLGMSMVINPNNGKNTTRTLANYQAAASKAKANIPPTIVQGGTSGVLISSPTK